MIRSAVTDINQRVKVQQEVTLWAPRRHTREESVALLIPNLDTTYKEEGVQLTGWAP